MPHARDRIRYPRFDPEPSEDRVIGARDYCFRLVCTLGAVADAIESLEPGKHPAAPWPAVGKKALLEVVVQGANSVTDAFNAAVLDRSENYIWNLPTRILAQTDLEIKNYFYNPLAEALTRRLEITLDLDEYEQTLERIIAELIQEMQAWKQIPDESGLVNALYGAVKAAGQVVRHTEDALLVYARAKELAAKGIMARDVTTKDIPAEIMARDVTTKEIPAEIRAMHATTNHMTTKTKTAVATTGSTVRPSWWKRLSRRRSV